MKAEISNNEVNKNQKYIICDSARGFWGKSDTLLEVITMLSQYLTKEIKREGKDRLCEFDLPQIGKVVVSTLGDPDSSQPVWLHDAIKTNARFIVTACRTSGSTVDVVYSIAHQYGYEIIWFKNFHFDSSSFYNTMEMSVVRHHEAQSIVDIIRSL